MALLEVGADAIVADSSQEDSIFRIDVVASSQGPDHQSSDRHGRPINLHRAKSLHDGPPRTEVAQIPLQDGQRRGRIQQGR